VPILYRGIFCTEVINFYIDVLKCDGSFAAKGFMNPEGIVAYHIAAGIGFKKTIEKDNQPKSLKE